MNSLYYSSLDNFFINKQCYKLFAYLVGGYQLKNVTHLPSFTCLRLKRVNMFDNSTFVALIDYELNDNLFVHYISVNPLYERKGIGSHLLKLAEENAIKQNINQSILYIHQNKRNYLFYKKQGYEINGNNKWKANPYFIELIKKFN